MKMKNFITSILIPLCVVFQSCGNTQEHNWINIKYVECLGDKLPCECEELIGTYYSVTVDTISKSKNYGVALSEFNQMEPYVYSIKRSGLNEYLVFESNNDSVVFGKLIFDKDTLILIKNNAESKFLSSQRVKVYDRDYFLIENVQLLNKSFAERGYPSLENIVKQDSLLCACNKWMGGVNLLFVKGSSQAWVLDIKNDILRVKTISNTAESDPDDPIITKILESYKW